MRQRCPGTRLRTSIKEVPSPVHFGTGGLRTAYTGLANTFTYSVTDSQHTLVDNSDHEYFEAVLKAMDWARTLDADCDRSHGLMEYTEALSTKNFAYRPGARPWDELGLLAQAVFEARNRWSAPLPGMN